MWEVIHKSKRQKTVNNYNLYNPLQTRLFLHLGFKQFQTGSHCTKNDTNLTYVWGHARNCAQITGPTIGKTTRWAKEVNTVDGSEIGPSPYISYDLQVFGAIPGWLLGISEASTDINSMNLQDANCVRLLGLNLEISWDSGITKTTKNIPGSIP